MARHVQPTDENIRLWEEWKAGMPEALRAAIDRCRLDPWTLYRLKSTGQRVYLLSLFEPKDDGKVTCRVGVSGEFNLVIHERDVFGIDVDDMVECDLPGPDEKLGTLDLSVAEVKELMQLSEVDRQTKLLELALTRPLLKTTIESEEN